MKHLKLFMLLFALPLLGIAYSCDDNDKPDVRVNVTSTNAIVDGTIYVVYPDSLHITGVNVYPAEGVDKATGRGPVFFSFNGLPCGPGNLDGAITIALDSAFVGGTYLLDMTMDVYQDDRSLATCWATMPVKVLADSTELPAAPADTIQHNVGHRISY